MQYMKNETNEASYTICYVSSSNAKKAILQWVITYLWLILKIGSLCTCLYLKLS